MPDINDILAVILGGGRGARLSPLTIMRSKPAVPIAGKYRLIDIPISNCVNSGIFKIAVLTQFNSVSLHRHITQTYNFDGFHGGWVQIWAAEQTLESENWYQGTADAVRKQKFEIRATGAKNVLILAGDHLYRMNYAAMAEFHWANQADITVAVQPVAREDASRFGILKREKDFRITDFVEKPADAETQARYVSRDDPNQPFLGSMGIYLFKTSLLLDLLAEFPNLDDFGGDVIPYAIKHHEVYGYDFNGYWRDIGTIRSFYETNLELAKPNHPFNFYDHKQPIYTHPRVLPSSIIEDSFVVDGMIAEGCIIRKAEIRHSIIGVRSVIQTGSRIVDTIMMGADEYNKPDEVHNIPIGVGAGSAIQGAILDKNAHIGENVVIRPFPPGTDLEDFAPVVVRDGIVVVPKDVTVPAGTVIAPK